MQMLRFHSSNFGFRHDLGHSRSPNNSPSSSTRTTINYRFHRQLRVSKILDQECKFKHNRVRRRCAMDEGSLGISSFDDWTGNVMTSDYVVFSSDGEDSDGEILVTPINDVDMPTIRKKFVTAEDAFTATAHRLAMFGKRHKKHRLSCVLHAQADPSLRIPHEDSYLGSPSSEVRVLSTASKLGLTLLVYNAVT